MNQIRMGACDRTRPTTGSMLFLAEIERRKMKKKMNLISLGPGSLGRSKAGIRSEHVHPILCAARAPGAYRRPSPFRAAPAPSLYGRNSQHRKLTRGSRSLQYNKLAAAREPPPGSGAPLRRPGA
jgi:hypothetical protein